MCFRGKVSFQHKKEREDPSQRFAEDRHDELVDLIMEVICLYALILGLVALSFSASDVVAAPLHEW